jgi:CxxC-x17-CxxC domain-containing protein
MWIQFVFSAGEQEFYTQRGFTQPVRCPACRRQRKLAGDRRNQTYRERGSPDSGPHQLYTVICAACGKEPQVPFVPRGDKPVYCRDCYQQQRRTSYRR